MDLSIIIPSFNTKNLLKECLSSVEQSMASGSRPLSYEIIVVDNASSDGSVEMTRKKFPETIIIENKKNLGYGKANNQAAAKAKGKYLLLLNSDAKALKDAIPQLYTFMEANNNVQVAGGRLLNSDGSPQPSCGPHYSLPVILGALFLRGDYWGLTRYSGKTVKKVDWVSGACLCIERKAFEKIGGFDEEIFMYMEEVELLYRAKEKGYQTYFYPGAEFIHQGSASLKEAKKPIEQLYKGFIYFYKKHKSGAQLFILQIMLLVKAGIGVGAGFLMRDKELQRVYSKAGLLAVE